MNSWQSSLKASFLYLEETFELEDIKLMCGIFGLATANPVALKTAFNVLAKLEVHQYPQEPNPVGGYGAGLAILQDDGSVIFEKVGKVADSSAKRLSEIVKVKEASVMVGHVRMPSPEFMETAKFRETAQPYVVQRDPKLTIISVHNGKVENYKQLRETVGTDHMFESEKVGLIDSEVIPHLFELLINTTPDTDEALYELFYRIENASKLGNAIGILQISEEDTYLHLIHKGKTRGLTVWTNEQGEVIFCSRKEPLMQEFGNILAEGKFKEKISIKWREDAGLKLSFPLDFRVKR